METVVVTSDAFDSNNIQLKVGNDGSLKCKYDLGYKIGSLSDSRFRRFMLVLNNLKFPYGLRSTRRDATGSERSHWSIICKVHRSDLANLTSLDNKIIEYLSNNSSVSKCYDINEDTLGAKISSLYNRIVSPDNTIKINILNDRDDRFFCRFYDNNGRSLDVSQSDINKQNHIRNIIQTPSSGSIIIRPVLWFAERTVGVNLIAEEISVAKCDDDDSNGIECLI